jgi:hypothetical protein
MSSRLYVYQTFKIFAIYNLMQSFTFAMPHHFSGSINISLPLDSTHAQISNPMNFCSLLVDNEYYWWSDLSHDANTVCLSL